MRVRTPSSHRPSVTTIGTMRDGDVRVILELGREVATGTYVLTRAQARAEVERLKKRIATVERLARPDRSYRLDPQPG